MSQGYARHDSAVGNMLASAREELNLSVADVARHLKLSPAQVEALESGAYERLPGRVFVRGFLRNYAKLLGIDPQPLLRSIESQIAQPEVADERRPSPKVVMPREQPARWPLYVALVAVVIVGTLAVYEFGFNEASQVPPKDADAGATTPNTGDAASAASTGQPAALAEPPSPLPDPLVTVAPAPVQTTVPGRRSGVPQGELVSANAAADPSGKGVRVGERELYFRFDEESWVEIRDRNDKVIFSKLNRAGSEERVNATPPLKLVVGNARGVRLNYGEQPVNLVPHTGVTVARLTLE